MEELSEAKLTRISGVWYGHSSLDSLEREAEAKALVNARLSAESLCRGLGGTLGEALKATNHQPIPGENAGAGFEELARVSKMGYGSEPKSKAEFMIKPDMISVHGLVHGVFLMVPAKTGARAKAGQ